MNLKKFIWLIAFSIAFTSCEEDPIVGCMDEFAENYNADAVEAAGCTYDAASILQDNKWLMESVTGDISGTEIDLLALTSLIPTCTHDNVFLFHADNSVTMEDNIDLCEDGEESVLDLTGTWTVNGDVLTIENGTDVYILSIDNLNSSSMDLLFNYYWADMDVDIPAKIVLVAN